jgi:ABC-type dipeptide/oligopeptide/nickel transport system ATPase component
VSAIFKKARREVVPAKIGLVGPSGSGKTYTALRLAGGLANGGRIALIDTEHGSASLYADEFDFDQATMAPPYDPARFAKAIEAATGEGYGVLIIDGISPAWQGQGGVLDIAEANKKGNNSFSGWSVATPAHQRLVDAILSAPIHLICTMRSKTAWVMGEGNKPEKVGLEPVQRDGIDYEFSVVGELDVQHRMRVSKSRLRVLEVGQIVHEPSEGLGAEIRSAIQTLRGSAQPADEPRPVPSSGPQERGGDTPLDHVTTAEELAAIGQVDLPFDEEVDPA